MKRNILAFIVALIAATLAYLFFAPVSIAPAAWTPPVAPSLTGPYQQNSRLAPVQRLSLGDGHSPEDVAVDADGRIYGGLEDGRIVQLQPDGTQPRVFANTHGRPLGLVFDRDGNLLVADALKGLLSISKAGEVKLLADGAEGAKFGCLNDLDVAADGTIYFTEASNKFPMSEHVSDLLEHQPNGRLLAWDPKTQKARTLLPGMYFANGVAVSPDQSFVLAVETGMYRVQRYWLTGPKQGQADVFIDNLPGFPDGISSNREYKSSEAKDNSSVSVQNSSVGGEKSTVSREKSTVSGERFWLSLVTPRQSLFDRLLPHPFLRKVVFRLPKSLQPAPQHYSFVLALDTQGRVIDNLQNGAPDCYSQIANTVEHNGALYFGSIGEDTIGRFTLPR
ncbi:MAG TPA: SMP-30/gluconolactonase/LRE family protein [Pyrinomonadaceae bacterium]|nr:SMP-30/gluconolactonase/LRE family protein [Pyrinomonadaceae bacterium]